MIVHPSGAEARARDDGGWELREVLEDGSIAIHVLKDGEDLWSGNSATR